MIKTQLHHLQVKKTDLIELMLTIIYDKEKIFSFSHNLIRINLKHFISILLLIKKNSLILLILLQMNID